MLQASTNPVSSGSLLNALCRRQHREMKRTTIGPREKRDPFQRAKRSCSNWPGPRAHPPGLCPVRAPAARRETCIPMRVLHVPAPAMGRYSGADRASNEEMGREYRHFAAVLLSPSPHLNRDALRIIRSTRVWLTDLSGTLEDICLAMIAIPALAAF